MTNPIKLSNDQLELLIDLPTQSYQGTRFDWTGKIVSLTFEGKSLSGREMADPEVGKGGGQGFYNEFGIDAPLGYADTAVGEWCHKIGVGLIKKEEAAYNFHKTYELKACDFGVAREEDQVRMSCQGLPVNGYAYLLKKTIRLLVKGFVIEYYLENQGEKPIITNEYSHNFLNIDQTQIGEAYRLRFPFELREEGFGERVNPEGLVEISPNEVRLKGTPGEPFFFSNLSGGEQVEAKWELMNLTSGLGISETGSFPTSQVNLWGCGHVISPELFFDIQLAPGESVRWSRTYRVLER